MAPCDDIFHIRRSREDDARGIAEVHVKTWRDAYRDQLPDAYLARLSVENRERTWSNELRDLPPDRRPWVAEAGGRIIGFVSVGGSRDHSATPGEAEVYAIYVMSDCWARGVGRNLLEHAERDLRAFGYSEAILWCFAANSRARAFYEKVGWKWDGGTFIHEIGGREVGEVRYRMALDRPRVATAS